MPHAANEESRGQRKMLCHCRYNGEGDSPEAPDHYRSEISQDHKMLPLRTDHNLSPHQQGSARFEQEYLGKTKLKRETRARVNQAFSTYSYSKH